MRISNLLEKYVQLEVSRHHSSCVLVIYPQIALTSVPAVFAHIMTLLYLNALDLLRSASHSRGLM